MTAVGLVVLGLTVEGPLAITRLQSDDVAAVLHLAIVVTALAFVLWYGAVGRIGPGRAGLFTGVVPIIAVAGGILLGGPAPARATCTTSRRIGPWSTTTAFLWGSLRR